MRRIMSIHKHADIEGTALRIYAGTYWFSRKYG